MLANMVVTNLATFPFSSPTSRHLFKATSKMSFELFGLAWAVDYCFFAQLGFVLVFLSLYHFLKESQKGLPKIQDKHVTPVL